MHNPRSVQIKMAVNDTTIFIGIAFILITYVLRQKMKILSNIFLMLLGLGMMKLETTDAWIGLLVATGGLALLIYDALTTPIKKRKK